MHAWEQHWITRYSGPRLRRTQTGTIRVTDSNQALREWQRAEMASADRERHHSEQLATGLSFPVKVLKWSLLRDHRPDAADAMGHLPGFRRTDQYNRQKVALVAYGAVICGTTYTFADHPGVEWLEKFVASVERATKQAVATHKPWKPLPAAKTPAARAKLAESIAKRLAPWNSSGVVA